LGSRDISQKVCNKIGGRGSLGWELQSMLQKGQKSPKIKIISKQHTSTTCTYLSSVPEKD